MADHQLTLIEGCERQLPPWFCGGDPGKQVPALQVAHVAAGRHPLGFMLQDRPEGRTCGNCEFYIVNMWGKHRYHVRRLNNTNGKANKQHMRHLVSPLRESCATKSRFKSRSQTIAPA